MPLPKLEPFDRAIALHQQGKTGEAAAVYREVIGRYPDHAGAWHLLGVTQHQQGDAKGALEAISRAIQIDGSQGVFFNNYGAALQALGRLVEALAFFRAAVQIKPEYLDAQVNLAALLDQFGQAEQAFKAYDRVLVLDPKHAAARAKAAQLAQKLAYFDRAAELLRGAIEQAEAGMPQRAFPTEVGTLTSSATGAVSEGLGTLTSYATTQNKLAELYNDLGNALVGACRADEAVGAYEQAAALAPHFAAAHFNLASARAELDQVVEARRSMDEACKLRPDKTVWKLRSAVLCPVVFGSAQALDEYRGKLEETLDGLLAARPAITWKDLLTTGFFPPFAASFQGRKNRRLKEKFAEVCRPWFTPEPRRPRQTDRLRVGFVVTRGHEGVFLRCTAGIVQHLDKARFEPVIFCAKGAADYFRKFVHRKDLEYVTFADDFREAAERVAAAHCDILYFWEVGSDAMNYFLPFMSLAPVQCTSWGTQVTCGVREVDYYLSSELIELPEADEHYTEKLWRLKSLPTYQRRISAPPLTNRDYFGLPEGMHLYLCPQNLLKLHPDQDELFGKLLRADPAGLLLIKEGRYRHPAEQLRARFAQTIPDVAGRTRFIPWQNLEDFYRLISVADVVLDVLYYTAGSSCYDMFSLNQPIITLPGELNVGRYTQACYRQMGFTDLVATSPDDYVSKAFAIASDPDYRHHIRQTLADRTPLLFEDLSSVHEHERFLQAAYAGATSQLY